MLRNYGGYAQRAMHYGRVAYPLVRAGYDAYQRHRGVKRKSNGPGGPGKSRRLNPPMRRRFGQSVAGISYGGGHYRYRKKHSTLSNPNKKYIKRMIQNYSSNGLNTYRNINSGQISCGINQTGYDQFNLNVQSEIDGVLNTAIQEITPANAVVTGVVDLTVNHMGKKVLIKNGRTTVCLRNNGQIPVYLDTYTYKCRVSTTKGPLDILTDAAASKSIANIGTDPRYNMYDAGHQLSQYWRLKRHKRRLLNGGDQAWVTMMHEKPFNFDYDQYIDQAQTYIKNRSYVTVCRVVGVVSHDSDTHANVGLNDGTLDWVEWKHYKYEATVDKNYHIANPGTGTLDAMANGPVVAGMDVEEIKLAL